MKKKTEKLVVFLICAALLFAGALIAGMSVSYLTFAGSLVGLATAFFAGHVGAQWVDSKTPEQIPPQQGE